MDIKHPRGNRGGKPTSKQRKKPAPELSPFTRNIVVTAGTVWVLALVVSTGSLAYGVVFANSAFPGSLVGTTSATGLSRTELWEVVDDEIKNIENQTWRFTYRDQDYSATSEQLGITMNSQKSIQTAWKVGRSENLFTNIAEHMSGLFGQKQQTLAYAFDNAFFEGYIAETLPETEVAPDNARLEFNENGAVGLIPSAIGRELDRELLRSDIGRAIDGSDHSPVIALHTYESHPPVTSNVARMSRQKIATLVRDEITLKHEDEDWTISTEEIASWVTTRPSEVHTFASPEGSFISSTDVITVVDDDTVSLEFADPAESGLVPAMSPNDVSYITSQLDSLQTPIGIREHVNAYYRNEASKATAPVILTVAIDKASLANTFDDITEEIDEPGQNARLGFSDGEIVVLEASQTGRGVDRKQAITDILNAINNNQPREIALVIDEIPAEITEDNFAQLGIKDLLASGTSDFAGSSTTRIHNIRTAMENYNGYLLAPGKEFSFVEILGDVDGSTGYLPELVIKGNKITPEYGGGVCQVSSTVFRAAVYAGLDITQRQNHSFVVSYYGTPGMDATIYIPSPDLRFVNNTPNYILMQPYIEGTILTFDFFGTSDGREVTTEGPYLYDRGAGGAVKASWTQIVYKDGEEVQRQTFNSSYKPVTSFERTGYSN